MWNIPNFLSFLRFPLAFLFIPDYIGWRVLVLILAMLSDSLDGFLARWWNLSTKFGAILDPIMDKFFAGVVLLVMYGEQKLSLEQIACLLSRDIAVATYGFILILQGRIARFTVRAIWCGKITTALQFMVFLGLLYDFSIPLAIYMIFIVLGCLSFIELALSDQTLS